MNRFFWACVLCWLCVAGCTGTSNTTTQNANRGATPAASPTAASTGQSNKPHAPGGGADTGTQASQGDVTGAYFPSEALPPQVAEIEHLSLATIDENGNPAPLNGFLRPKRRSATDYQLVKPQIKGRELSFTTSTVGGVGYSFKGTFEKMDNFAANPPPSDEVILRGVLTRTEDGVIVFETDVNFTYSAGG